MTTLGVQDLAALFGTTPEKVEARAGALMRTMDLSLRPIEGTERDDLVLGVLRRIDAPELKTAGGHREQDWEDGWRENLDDFVASGFDLRALIPRYYKPNVPIRLNRRYVLPSQPDFVYRYTELFRACLLPEHLGECPSVYEFGCGTGHNLVHLDELCPGKALHGFDWARSSQEILALLAERKGLSIRGGHFDLFEPDASVRFDRGAGVLTFGALEQIGPRHGPYLDFLLARKPAVCVDVVGIEELYDAANLFDYVALAYHRRRGYLSGYLTRLRELEASGAVEIIRVHRHLFGNVFDEPYSYVVWRPR
jgi:SAM-dependent methyltransferase